MPKKLMSTRTSGCLFQIENRTQILYSICKKVLDSLGDRD